MASWIQSVDKAVHTMIFNRFAPFLSLTDQSMDSVFYPHDLAIRFVSEKRAEKLTEFISVWRYDPPAFDWSRQSTAIARNGMKIPLLSSSGGFVGSDTVTITAVPSLYNYTFRLWSRDFDKLTEAADSYLKWIHDHPNMIIYFAGLYEMDMYLKFGDGKDVTNYNFFEQGEHLVYEFPLTVEGWQLTSVTTSWPGDRILKIILDVFLREGTAPNYSDTLVSEYIITP